MFNIISIKNKQNVELEGYFFQANSNSCILHIPGFGGAFDSLPELMGGFFQEKKINYLCGLTQGSYPEHDFKQFKDTTHFVLKKGGAIYENYEDCLLDIDGWITFLLKKALIKFFY